MRLSELQENHHCRGDRGRDHHDDSGGPPAVVLFPEPGRPRAARGLSSSPPFLAAARAEAGAPPRLEENSPLDGANSCQREGGDGNGCQLLVTFMNRTHVLNVGRGGGATRGGKDSGGGAATGSVARNRSEIDGILSFVSSISGWPEHRLVVASLVRPFCAVRAVSSIRGGKGGFGTLLKGQSRQAANKTTLDFGSCRDLQGRRLRTVNDEIARRLRREWQDKVDTGRATQQEMIQALSDTHSGIAGWFLQLPAWAEKGSRKVARKQHHLQLRTWKSEEREREFQRESRRKAQERAVEGYVQSAQQSLAAATSHLQEAVRQGLVAAAASQKQDFGRKRKDRGEGGGEGAVEPKAAEDAASPSPPIAAGDEGDAAALSSEPPADPTLDSLEETDPSSSPPSALVALSGEVVEVPPGNGETPAVGLRGASNFATVGVLLPRGGSAPPPEGGLYYEVVVRTAGLAQIGWLSDAGAISSESGDGVGDAPGSWSYDGSRQIKLAGADPSSSSSSAAAAATDAAPAAKAAAAAASSTEEYGSRWKEGDVVGCLWRSDPSGGSVRYFLNGADQGVAFGGVQLGGGRALVPAVSLNPGEVVEIRLSRGEFQYYSEAGGDATPVGELLLEQVLSTEAGSRPADSSSEQQQESEQDRGATDVKTAPPPGREPEEPSPIVLEDYDSVESLEGLGLDRLKRALADRGLKCGGTARERAARLFSVKGLSPREYPPKLLAKK